MNILQERTIALSGVFQCCGMVQSLARQGQTDDSEEQALVQSISILDAVSTPSIYGGISGVNTGLNYLSKGILTTTSPDHLEVIRYATQILTLQRGLYADHTRFAEFATEVERLSSKSQDDVILACSHIYQSFVSPLRPQIIVQGEEKFLQQENIPERIRTLLLAAIRSAVLWQQKGGGRFRLIWERTRMQNAAKDLLQNNGVH